MEMISAMSAAPNVAMAVQSVLEALLLDDNSIGMGHLVLLYDLKETMLSPMLPTTIPYQTQKL